MSIPRGMLDYGWFVVSISVPGISFVLCSRRLFARRYAAGDRAHVVVAGPRGDDARLYHFCYRAVAAMTISLDAIFRHLGSPVASEKTDDDFLLEIRALCTQSPRLHSRDDVLRTVATAQRTTSEKPVLQVSS
jgi:hypothetical protein